MGQDGRDSRDRLARQALIRFVDRTVDLLRRHCRDERELRRLREHFASEYGYTTATGIPHPDAFATWLGIDFAWVSTRQPM